MTLIQRSPNVIENGDLLPYLGEQGLFQLLQLKKWLTTMDVTKENWEKDISLKRDVGTLLARFAPSIISRSEAELFSISLPRFAIRVFLSEDQGSFVNARRTAEFADQARTWGKRRGDDVTDATRLKGVTPLGRRQMLPDSRLRLARTCPGWILHSNSCIGDSILATPTRFSLKYKVLERNLGRLYGEKDAEGKPLRGTPYIRHIPLSGGGLCAQAVCFMATLLQYEHATGVFGIAEITKLAFDPKLREIPITGLGVPAIKSYFANVGLATASQLAGSGDDFKRALQAYLNSEKDQKD
jgi:hypothetical protein